MIEIPLAGNVKEYTIIKDELMKVAEELAGDTEFKIGSMIEIPRIVFHVDKLAPHCDFISFGTNDLT